MKPTNEIKILDVTCRPIFSSAGDLSFEIYVKISPNASGIGQATGIKFTSKKNHPSCTLMAQAISIKNYISFFNEEVKPQLLSSEFSSQETVDSLLFEIGQKSLFSSNFFSPISIAIAKAASAKADLPLYVYLKNLTVPCKQLMRSLPIFNILDATRSICKDSLSISFLLIPSYKMDLIESLMMGSQVLSKTREICWEDNKNYGIAPRGGVLTKLKSCEEGFDLILKAASQCKYRLEEDFHLGIDFEAEHFSSEEGFRPPWSKSVISADEHIDTLLKLTKLFPLTYIEDPFLNRDIDSWKSFMKKSPHSMMLVGDAFFPVALEKRNSPGKNNLINSFVLKPDQFPTVTAALNTIHEGIFLGWSPIVSHRTINNDDSFLSHFSVASGAQYIKAGGMHNMEHIKKYNELMRIYNA